MRNTQKDGKPASVADGRKGTAAVGRDDDTAGLLSVSLCGMSNETIPAAETVLPKNLCPLIKSSYGFAITDKCPYTYWSDLIVGETTCDGATPVIGVVHKTPFTFSARA